MAWYWAIYTITCIQNLRTVYCMKILFIRSPYQTIDVQMLHINKMQTYLQKLKIISREKLDSEYLQILFFFSENMPQLNHSSIYKTFFSFFKTPNNKYTFLLPLNIHQWKKEVCICIAQ